jgi:hypothetical protein
MRESNVRDSDPRNTALTMLGNTSKLQTRPFVREGAPHQQTRNSLTVLKIWSRDQVGCPTVRQSGHLTVGHNINSLREYALQKRVS